MYASLVNATVRERLGGFDDQRMRERTGDSSDHAVLRSPLELDLRWLAGYRFVILFSAGPNGIIDIPSSTATSALTTSSIGDDLYVALMLR